MRCLSLQIQPDRIPNFDAENAVKQLIELATKSKLPANVDVQQGSEDGRYINVFWTTRDYATLWKILQQELERDEQLSNCSIACCEGQHGWDDHLLLHHYDPAQQLDDLADNEKK